MELSMPTTTTTSSKSNNGSASGSSASSKRGRKADESVVVAVETVSAQPVESTTLPLFEDAVSFDIKIRSLKVGLTLLRLTSNGKSTNVNIPQAAMQMIAHLTRLPEARKEFHAQQGGVLVLRCRSTFAGMHSVVFTLLQQVLEDEKFLTQSMITAIRLCLLRLSKQTSQNVLLKSFIEVISPVVFRQQALFMQLLKSHTHIKAIAGQNFISLKDTSAEEKPAANEQALVPVSVVADPSITVTAAEPAVASLDAPVTASKKQRLADGSAATTAQSATKASLAAAHTTPGASHTASSGIKSGAKRVLSAVSDANPSVHSAVKTPQHSNGITSNNETVSEIVDELFTRIICKWLSIKTIDAEGNTKITSDFSALDSSLTIAQLLIIAADLIASLPTFAISVHRYCFNLSKVPAWAAEVAAKELPVKHALTGQPLGGLFITFLVHALLLPARIAYPAESDAATDSLPAAEAKTKKTARNTAVDKLAGAPGVLRDACSYFLASLSSRPGEGRKRVLNEVLNTANIGSVVVNTTDKFRALVAFSETLLYLLNPPRKWASRDAFILPAKDILASLAKQNAHMRISAAICALDLSHPLALETSIVLAVPLDAIIRKGLEPAPLAATLLAGADASVAKPAVSGAAARVSGAAAGTSSASRPPRPPAASEGVGATTTPSVRRTTFATTVGTAAGPSQTSTSSNAASAQSFVTPASNRRRGNTDQSLDAEERLLLLTGSEMHNQSDHLVRPTGAYSSDEGGSDDDDDFEGEGEDGGHHEAAGALGAGEVFHMHDEDDEVRSGFFCCIIY